MKTQLLQAILLAWRDWKFESLLSLCSVLALASMLSPILVLQGLKNGVIEGMRSRLLEDPAILIITPKSDAGRFSKEDINNLAKLPGARYAIGRTRETATDLTILNPHANARASIALEPASPGEPVLDKYKLPIPEAGNDPGIVLSQAAAKVLKASLGMKLEAKLNRKTPEGRFESVPLSLQVQGILPVEAADRKMGFVALSLLEDMENYRDFIAVPTRGFSGNESSDHRSYASFRLYASQLADVENLAALLAERKIEVITRAREIAGIRLLEQSINQVIFIVSIAVGAGFVAFTMSSVQSSVSRKKKMLGILRLLGFYRLPLSLYPITQTLLTAISGFILSLGIYFCVSLAIKNAFADQGALSTQLSLADISIIGSVVILLSLFACAGAAAKAGSVEPSMVIREV